VSWSTPPFRHAIRHLVGDRDPRVDRAHVDDRRRRLAGLDLRDHLLRGRLPDQEHALEVDAQHAVEVGLRDVEEIRRVDDAGIVHQDVEIADDAAGFRHRRCARLRRADIGAHEARRRAERGGRGLAGALVDVRDDDARAFRDVASGDRKPDAARPAGHDRGLSVEHAHRASLPALRGRISANPTANGKRKRRIDARRRLQQSLPIDRTESLIDIEIDKPAPQGATCWCR
jgi:hypothetical protein